MSAAKRKFPVGSAQDWLRHAASDLAFANLGLESDEVLTEQVCFHAQQSVEKSLKAWLIWRELKFPPVHDLEQLLDIMRQASVALPEWSDELLSMTPYAVEIRYPGYWEEISAAERDRALELAAMTLDWVKQQIQPQNSETTFAPEDSDTKDEV